MPKLPPGWSQTTDARGRTYYYNAETQESSWTPPPGTIEDPPPRPAGPPAIPPSIPTYNTPAAQVPPALPPQLPPLPVQPQSSGPPRLPALSVSTNSQPPAFPISPASSTSSRGPPPFGSTGSVSPRGGPPPLPGGGPPGFRPGPPSLPAQKSLPPAIPPAVPPAVPPAIPPAVPPALPGAGPGGPPSLPPMNRPGPSSSVSHPPAFGAPQTSLPPLPTQQPHASAAPTGPPAIPSATAAQPPARPMGTSPPPPPVPATNPNALPVPWKEAKSPDGRTYYYNAVTQETSWVRPSAPAIPGGVPPMPPGGMTRPMAPSMSAPPTAIAPSHFTASLPSQQQQQPHYMQPQQHFTPGANTTTPATEPMFSKNFAGTILVRSGVFKSWSTQYVTIKPQSQLQLYDNEQMKKVRLQVNLANTISTPITRGDGRLMIFIYEYDKKHLPVTRDSLVSHASKTHCFDANTEQAREILLSTLENQGSIIRRPIVELPCSWNKNQERFCTVFHHQLELFRKSTDDDPEIIVPFTGGTFFQSEPSVFPLLYEEKEYGPISPQTFVIGDHCDEGATLYYITLNTAEGFESLIKKTGQAIDDRRTKIDPESLMEGYLYKASSNLTRWARRYFILRNDSLKYYKERGATKPAGEIPLPLGFEIDMHPKTEYPHSIFVAESGDAGTRQYLASALNQTEYDLWSDALTTLQQKKQIKKVNTSQKEGYAFICGQRVKPSRKYAVVTADNILEIYNTRNDTIPSKTLSLVAGMGVQEASLPGDDTIQSQKLNILSISSPGNNEQDTYLGFGSAPTREDWLTLLKGIVGDSVVKSHPDSVKEGYMYKSKKRGKTGSIKYVVITPRAIYYADTKTPNIAEAPKAKKWDLVGDAPINEIHEVATGFYGLEVASTGDESGVHYMYLYFTEQEECHEYLSAIRNAILTVDWRRDPTSLFEGYLYKSNTSGKSWQYRYHVLHKQSLTYYKRKYDEKPAGQIPIVQGFTIQKISNLDTSITGDNRTAVDHFTSTIRLKKHDDTYVLAIIPPSGDTTSRKIWVASADHRNLTPWMGILNDLAIWDKLQYPYGIKEGYMYVNGYGDERRKYVALFNEKIIVQHSKTDSTLDTTLLLTPGFDIVAFDDHFYISPSGGNDLSQYIRFASCYGGDTIQSWLKSIQQVYQARTPQPSSEVKFQSYLYIQRDGSSPSSPGPVSLPSSVRFVVLTDTKFMIYETRSLCYPKDGVNTIDLTGAVSNQTYDRIRLTQDGKIEVIDVPETLDIIVKLDGITYKLTARTLSEKTHTFNTLTAAFAGQTHHRASVAARPAAFAVAQQQPPAVAPGGGHYNHTAPGMSYPQLDDDEAPPPPTFFDEDDDPPPPPPPDMDFDDDMPMPPPPMSPMAPSPPPTPSALPPPVSPTAAAAVPPPVAVAAAPPPQQRAFAPPTNAAGVRKMPIHDSDDDDSDDKPPGYVAPPPGSMPPPVASSSLPTPMPSSSAPPSMPEDDSDDDLPFLKARKQQQAAAAAAAAAPTPPPMASTPAPAPAASSTPYKPAASSLDMDFGFDFAFELPPPPEDMGLPPPPSGLESQPSKPAAPAAASPPPPSFDDDDDDDLPPPPGGGKK